MRIIKEPCNIIVCSKLVKLAEKVRSFTYVKLLFQPPFPRGYPPPANNLLFDDDPGIMSEVETASTGFRRGGKQRSSLPVVRTPSKTLERPLGKFILTDILLLKV